MTFPFTAIVGQEQFKLALLLNSIDPSLGGVLAIGDKGTGKTTLIRSLSDLLNCTFVNLPIGAAEDRVLGHINLEKLINDKSEEVQLGLLAQANKGFLYIDEINLLNDYLMDVLLDASASGEYYLEREGISKKFDSKFCLVGSMNPEEGDLRPQLKDRFGLSVQIKTPTLLEDRTKIVSNRLAFDSNPTEFITQFKEEQQLLQAKITLAKSNVINIPITVKIIEYCTQLALDNAVEGMRADILLVKAARAYAAFHQKESISTEDVDAIKDFVLHHRQNNTTPPPPSPPQNQEKEEKPKEEKKPEQAPKESAVFKSIIPEQKLQITEKQDIGIQQTAPKSNLKNSIDRRKSVGQYLAKDQFEIFNKPQEEATPKQIIFLLDSSGSMINEEVITLAKGVIEKIVSKNQNAPLQFSLIALLQGDATIIKENTSNIKVFIKAIQELESGGKTNIIAGFKCVKSLLAQTSNQTELVVVSDGHFCSDYGLEDIIGSYQFHCKKVQQLTLIDTETGIVQLGIMKRLADALKGTYQKLLLEQ
ncbi:AAA family ATPase [Flammeovirga kamogawensis]|uniref:AAA family ATPase n=1 Tax=Flammeovirga kamogawensis TaxID=373891 RepID=A0ABX8H3F4_9BACT|nr:AAA family ATPase [Flammeovirga kamogawensis]MBB6460345.1 magnesium chelatase subunit D [Flammeovirga kamogawensis]QWG10154.1 AAA family ATPase [Flammeovirga kamogawensis]TRX64606.1 VWA domain-containing protein [Flammeovirga kamogawensis]